MLHRIAIIAFLAVWLPGAGGQVRAQDSTGLDPGKTLDSVVVTATRRLSKIGNVAIPVTVIGQKTIMQSGSLRLNDILNEQTGLFITNSYAGQGLQMQGFDPDYTLILIDGEPLVGRNSGVLDLSRIGVTNIRKIEIVKGPSSSLYGSDAMAGVVNIITDNPRTDYANLSARYGSFRTTDLNAGGGLVKGKWNAGLQGNYYSTAGYNLTGGAAQTVDPFHNYSLQATSGYRFSGKTNWVLHARYFQQQQTTKPYQAGSEQVSGNASSGDLNVNNTFTHRFSDQLLSSLRIYFTAYRTDAHQWYTYPDPANNSLYHDQFRQNFTRLENQTEWNLTGQWHLTAGGGWIFDHVASNRYDTGAVRKTNNIGYVFGQAEWKPFARSLVTAGLRYDYNQNYQSRLSPKLAVKQIINDKLSIDASVGVGFKAPDFRQLYLDFTNTIPGTGYTVFGNTEVGTGMALLERQGLIQTVYTDPATIRPLKAETSTGINLGINYRIGRSVVWNVNFFRNDIDNLILTESIAQKTNGMLVYSYFNVTRAFTEGIESNIHFAPVKGLQVTLGYQLLFTGNKDDIERIKTSHVYGRDNGNVYLLTRRDYRGLMYRSKHSANLKVVYEAGRWFFTGRLLFRSGWGVVDADGNGLLNRGDTFTKNFWQLNVSAGRELGKGFALQAGSNDLLNWKDAQYSPNIPGRTLYATLSYTFIKPNRK